MMILLAKMGLGMAGAAIACVGVVCSEGLVQVKVIDRAAQGHHIHIIAPAILAPVAVHLAPQRELARAAQDIQPCMPAIRAVLAGLRDADDIVLVEVREPGEFVQVSKSGGAIVVDVDNADETVHVSAPIRAVSSTIEQLAAATSNPL